MIMMRGVPADQTESCRVLPRLGAKFSDAQVSPDHRTPEETSVTISVNLNLTWHNVVAPGHRGTPSRRALPGEMMVQRRTGKPGLACGVPADRSKSDQESCPRVTPVSFPGRLKPTRNVVARFFKFSSCCSKLFVFESPVLCFTFLTCFMRWPGPGPAAAAGGGRAQGSAGKGGSEPGG